MEVTMETEKKLEQTNGKEVFAQKQKAFLDSTFGKIINTTIDVGLRFILPDFLENQVIEIKNQLFEGGIKQAIEQAVSSAMDMGRSIMGIATGKFENIGQIEMAVKKGGVLDSTARVIDSIVTKLSQKGKIEPKIANMIKKGKSVILDNISVNIEEMLTNQIKTIEKLGKSCENWKEAYSHKDLKEMEKEYSEIKKQLKEMIPFETILKQAREIENRHLLIKNNGGEFSLSEQEKKVAQKLI